MSVTVSVTQCDGWKLEVVRKSDVVVVVVVVVSLRRRDVEVVV